MRRALLLAASLLAAAPALAAQEPTPATVRVTIHVIDPANRRGIEGMQLRVGTMGATSDRRGDVVFGAMPAGTHTLEFTHATYGGGTAQLVVSGPGAVEFELPVPRREAILDPLQVTARRLMPGEFNDRSRGRRQNVLTRADIEARLASARDVGDLVRTFPALQVTEVQYAGGSGMAKEICITDRSGPRNSPLVTRQAREETEQSNRRAASMGSVPPAHDQMRGQNDEKCEGVAVAVDDRLVAGQTGEFLRTFSLDQVESVFYLRPSEATTRFGSGGANGVILIYTRGNGPTVQNNP